MRKKGYTRTESPEKMPVVTTGIEMTRDALKGKRRERLTGGNAPADERGTVATVLDFMRNIYR